METKKKKIVVGVLLFLIFVISLFLRVYFPWDSVFSDPIKYAADDGVYHMRLVENMLLGGHFPSRIYFDAYTYFPYGTYIHFAPLYEWLLAFIIWIVGFGHPTLALINKIAPFYPAVLGSLTVLVIYFIGKALWGKWAGLISATLMGVFSPFLFRSLLGATDHHQAEVLFSSLAILFLILAFQAGKASKWRKFWFYTLLTGFSLGLYFLVWNGALLFLFVIFISIILYYFIEYFYNYYQDWVLIMGSIIFFITLIMLIPFLGHPDIFHAALYNIRHISSLVIGICLFLFIRWFCNFSKERKIEKIHSIEILILLGFVFFLIIQNVFPFVFEEIITILKSVKIGMVPHELAREMIGEMSPLGIQGAFNNFGNFLYFSFIGLGLIIYNFIRKRKPEDFLIVVWFLIIVLITGILIPAIGQNRFTYYLSANIALISGFLIIKTIRFVIAGIKSFKEKGSNQKIYLYVGLGSLCFNLIFFVFYPFPFNLIYSFPNNLPKIINDAIRTGKFGVVARSKDYYETLRWLKENTPDPGIDYYALYEEPKFNSEIGKIEPYSYPETAYGIMSSWDLGHMITYYAHRIPNANPFQQGIGRIKKDINITEPGESTFFIETDEEKATKFLDELKTKYIITDFGEVIESGGFVGKVKWAQSNLENYYLQEGEDKGATTRKYDKSIVVRLHLFDGREWFLQGKEEESKVEPLDYFRLVYESQTPARLGFFENPEKDNIKLVKIFEYVKGAKIIGNASIGTEIEISTKIKTNQQREFIYKKRAKVNNGKFEFIVPYSTFGQNGWLDNGTKFGVFAKPYELTIGDIKREINVSEEDVLGGNIINI